MKKLLYYLLLAFCTVCILLCLILATDAELRTGAIILIVFFLLVIALARKFLMPTSSQRKKTMKSKISDFVAFDFETTGLEVSDSDIIQAGAVRYENGIEVDSYASYAKPYKPISAKISAINGITNDDVKDAPCPEEVIQELIAFIDGMPLVAHNAPFDLKFLRKYAPNYYPETYDTLTMARAQLPGMSHKLGDLMEHFGIKGDWHDARSDCRSTAEIFLRLQNRKTIPFIKGNTHPGSNQPVTHYISEQSMEDYEHKKAAGSKFTDAEQPFIDAFNNLDFSYPVIPSKKSGYIVFRTLGCELLRVKVNKKLQYALLQGSREDNADINLELTDATATELKAGNCIRAILSKPEDLAAFTNRLKAQENQMSKQLTLLPLKWTPKQ